MARPRKEIPLNELKALMRMMPSLKDTAAFFECSIETIETRIKEYTGLSFPEFREQNMVHSRLKLVRKALEMADAGNTAMVIFCLKNLCGWADKVETKDTSQKNPYEIQIKNPELLKSLVKDNETK